MAETRQQAPAGGGSILTQRLGPLATWVWLLIATLLVGGLALLMRRKAGNNNGQAQPGQATGAQNVPDIIIQNSQSQTTTGDDEDTETKPPPTHNPPPKGPPPKGPPPPHHKPPGKKPRYAIVTVSRYTGPGNKPWNGTLSGIADHYHTSVAELAKLNGIKNVNLIHPGQKIRVPVSA